MISFVYDIDSLFMKVTIIESALESVGLLPRLHKISMQNILVELNYEEICYELSRKWCNILAVVMVGLEVVVVVVGLLVVVLVVVVGNLVVVVTGLTVVVDAVDVEFR